MGVFHDRTAEFQLSHKAHVSGIYHKQLKIGQYLSGSVRISYSHASLQLRVDVIR